MMVSTVVVAVVWAVRLRGLCVDFHVWVSREVGRTVLWLSLPVNVWPDVARELLGVVVLLSVLLSALPSMAASLVVHHASLELVDLGPDNVLPLAQHDWKVSTVLGEVNPVMRTSTMVRTSAVVRLVSRYVVMWTRDNVKDAVTSRNALNTDDHELSSRLLDHVNSDCVDRDLLTLEREDLISHLDERVVRLGKSLICDEDSVG